jgi:hypothetical protein
MFVSRVDLLTTKEDVRILLPEGAAYAFTQVRKTQPPRAPPIVSLFKKGAGIGCIGCIGCGDASKVCFLFYF